MKKHTLKINSDIHEMAEVERFVEDICDYYNLNNTYFGNIIVAISEAVENAVMHGNKNKQEKQVAIGFELTERGIFFTVEDEGTGFDYTNVPDATDIDQNPEKKGTGIYLIRALSDEVNFLENGKKIQMVFNTTAINKEIFLRRKKYIDEYFKVKKDIFEKNS